MTAKALSDFTKALDTTVHDRGYLTRRIVLSDVAAVDGGNDIEITNCGLKRIFDAQARITVKSASVGVGAESAPVAIVNAESAPIVRIKIPRGQTMIDKLSLDINGLPR